MHKVFYCFAICIWRGKNVLSYRVLYREDVRSTFLIYKSRNILHLKICGQAADLLETYE